MTSRLGLLSALACAISCAFAWWIGGSRGLGWSAGFVAAASLSLWGTLYQRRLMRAPSGQPMQAVVLAFLVKLAVLFFAALAVRFVPEIGERVDWMFLVLGFPAGIVTVLAIATADHWASMQRQARSA